MAIPDDFKNFVEDLFAGFGAVTIRSMFGGGGVFHEGVMIAIIAGAKLYLKADETSCPDFAAEGKGPFRYEARGKAATMSYWEVPERLYDDPDDFALWARKAHEIALKGKKNR